MSVDPAMLRDLLRYEPETGHLFWLPRPRELFISDRTWRTWNSQNSGKHAFKTPSGNGYLCGSLHNRMYLAHRVIWALAFGKWPNQYIDHINGMRTDNRLCNLREANASENLCNRGPAPNNKSGYKGVFFHKQRQRWCAFIEKDYKSYFGGYHESAEEAAAAYKVLAAKHHGEFSQTERNS